MINFISKIFSTESLRKAWPWIFLIIGVGLYVYGYRELNTKWAEIAIEIANILIVGVVLGFVTNAAQFIGIFKSDLQDIIFGEEFIKKRNDLPKVEKPCARDPRSPVPLTLAVQNSLTL